MTLRVAELFAGGGGGILGWMLKGCDVVCAVEIEEYCRDILRARQRDGYLPADMQIHDDVRTFDGHPWRGKVDVVSGGFPCQDISVAGNGAGLDGERSSLWYDMLRVIGEVRPRYAFIENSPALANRGLDVVLSGLHSHGYGARWDVVSAWDAGAWNLRERIWILASTDFPDVPPPLGWFAHCTGDGWESRTGGLFGPEPYRGKWPRWGRMNGGKAWEVPAVRFDADAGGRVVMPTLVAADTGGSRAHRINANRKSMRADGTEQSLDLRETVALMEYERIQMPTLTVHGNYNRAGASANSGDGLATAVKAMEDERRQYPTLTVACATGGQVSRGGDRADELLLTGMVQQMERSRHHTLTARDHAPVSPVERAEYGAEEARTTVQRLRVQVDAMEARRAHPTLTKADGEGGPGNSGRDGGDNLRTAVQRMAYPTLTKSDHKQRRPPEQNWRLGTDDLVTSVWRQEGGDEDKSKACAALNPPWCAWTMGWPHGPDTDWTSLDPLPPEVMADWWAGQYWQADPGDGNPPAIPRTATGVAKRQARIKALGNGQVPAAAALAWRVLLGDDGE